MSTQHFYTSNGSIYANDLDKADKANKFAFNVSLQSGLLTASLWMTDSEILELRDAIDKAITHRQSMKVAA